MIAAVYIRKSREEKDKPAYRLEVQPRELTSPPWYAVTMDPPIEYRLPIDGRWVLAKVRM